ncbi:helix-turn-helix domain-containing protein [Micrococcaceae bacterium Sec6.3]
MKITGGACSAFVFPEGIAVAAVRAPLDYMTQQDAAEALGISLSTIRRMIARGELRAYRFGPRVIRIDPADLRAMRRPVTSLAELRGGDAA